MLFLNNLGFFSNHFRKTIMLLVQLPTSQDSKKRAASGEAKVAAKLSKPTVLNSTFVLFGISCKKYLLAICNTWCKIDSVSQT